MVEKTYHHGNLRNSLIEAGIELLNSEGEKNFSIRKVAVMCGVSNAAPYSHFKSKQELLEAMKSHVTDKFTEELNCSIKDADLDDPYTLVKLGKSYVMFFIKNPQYYQFLFSQSCIKVNLNMNEGEESNYPPFNMLKDLHFKILGKMGFSEEKIKNAIISAWSTVHGLAAIATMKGVTYDGNWENKIEDIIWNR